MSAEEFGFGTIVVVRLPGLPQPQVAHSNTGTIYFDTILNLFMVSENGGAYVPLVGGGGGGSLQVSYNLGATINLNANGPVTLNKGAVDATDALVVNVTGGSGDAIQTSGGAVRLTGGSSLITVGASTTTVSDGSVTRAAGNLTLQAAGAADDLLLSGRAASTALNQLGQTALNGAYTGVGRTSLIGALNALVDGAVPPSASTLSAVLVAGNTTGARDIVVSAGQQVLGATNLSIDSAAAATINVGTVNAATINIGTGLSAINVQGNAIISGDLTVNGTVTTINSTNTSIADQELIIAAQGVPGPEVRSAYTIERGTSGDDLLFYWNTAPARVEIGFFDTVGGTVVPGGSLASLADTRVKNLSLSGTTITADAALTVTATAAALGLAATGANRVNVSTNGVTRFFAPSDGGQEFVGLAADPAVSAGGNGKIIFNSTTNTFRISQNGGAYADLATATSVTLQQAYDNGEVIVTTTADGAIEFTGSNANNDNVLEIRKSPVGAQSGAGVFVSMNANATGPAAIFSGATTSSAMVYVGNGQTSAAPITGTVHGTDASAIATAGGGITIRAGAGNTTGAGGTTSVLGGAAGASGAGGAVAITAGDAGTLAGVGGSVTVTAGTGNSGAGSAGGDVTITAGHTTAVAGPGGAATLVGGVGGAGGRGGTCSVVGGAGGASDGAGGPTSVQGGLGTGTGNGGAVTMSGGTPGATGNGGDASVFGGSGGGTSGTGGQVSVFGGDANSGNSSGGTVTIRGGLSRGNATGAGVVIRGGESLDTANGGTVLIQGGESGTGATGGGVSLVGGTSDGANPGGTIAILGGTSGATGSGGPVQIEGALGGVTSGVGGAVAIAGGAGVAGNSAGGAVSLTGGAGQGSATGGAASVVGGVGGATGAGGDITFLCGGWRGNVRQRWRGDAARRSPCRWRRRCGQHHGQERSRNQQGWRCRHGDGRELLWHRHTWSHQRHGRDARNGRHWRNGVHRGWQRRLDVWKRWLAHDQQRVGSGRWKRRWSAQRRGRKR
jgi:hypothetical protein